MKKKWKKSERCVRRSAYQTMPFTWFLFHFLHLDSYIGTSLEDKPAYLILAIVYLWFSILNAQLSALELEFVWSGIVKVCLLLRSANRFNPEPLERAGEIGQWVINAHDFLNRVSDGVCLWFLTFLSSRDCKDFWKRQSECKIRFFFNHLLWRQ